MGIREYWISPEEVTGISEGWEEIEDWEEVSLNLSELTQEQIDELNSYNFDLHKVNNYLKSNMFDTDEELRILYNAIKIFSPDMTLEWFKNYLEDEREKLDLISENTAHIDEIEALIVDLENTWEL